jgi:hypothetical protein
VVRSRREEHAWGQMTFGRHRRAALWRHHWREEFASRRSTVERRSARIDPCSTSETAHGRLHRDCPKCVPWRCARGRYAVRAWRRGRRDTTRIEFLPRLFWAHERVAWRLSQCGRPPREVVRGAFDEREESLRPRASLPVTP